MHQGFTPCGWEEGVGKLREDLTKSLFALGRKLAGAAIIPLVCYWISKNLVLYTLYITPTLGAGYALHVPAWGLVGKIFDKWITQLYIQHTWVSCYSSNENLTRPPLFYHHHSTKAPFIQLVFRARWSALVTTPSISWHEPYNWKNKLDLIWRSYVDLPPRIHAVAECAPHPSQSTAVRSWTAVKQLACLAHYC